MRTDKWEAIAHLLVRIEVPGGYIYKSTDISSMCFVPFDHEKENIKKLLNTTQVLNNMSYGQNTNYLNQFKE